MISIITPWLNRRAHRSQSVVGVSMLAVVAILGCSKAAKTPPVPAVPVIVAHVTITNIPVRISAIGNVMAYSTVTIRAQVTGQISEVHFKEGQEVKKGDLLFTIDPRPFEAALLQARATAAKDVAQMQNLQIQFDREKQLFAQQIDSQDQYDTAKAALMSQQGLVTADNAAITNAALNLEFTAITSPIDGVVGEQLVYPGNIIKAEDAPMAMVNQIHPISVEFSAPEQYLAEIKHEMQNAPLRVEVTFQNMTGDPVVGELTFIDNAVDPTSGTIQLKGTIANEDNRLWPGQFVRVQLTLSQLPNALVVPTQAVETGQNGQYVYVIKGDQTADERMVNIGTVYNGMTVVEKGLTNNEVVVTDGQMRLTPGTKVSLGPPTNSVAKPTAK